MRNLLAWAVFNIGFAFAVWFGLVEGVEGALYLAQFMVWVIALPVGLLSLSDDAQKRLLATPAPNRPIRREVGWLINWFVLGMFVWHGHFATAVAYGIFMIAVGAWRSREKKLRESASNTPAA